jgi:hypothetical protein
MSAREQKLVDITFQVALMIKSRPECFLSKTDEEMAEWVAYQLDACGFPTKPVGMSYGVLQVK